MSITRHRVGARVKARVRGFGQDRIPAYLITIRITENFGQPVDPAVAEGWIRTLVPAEMVGAVHEVSRGPNATYVWLVDSSYQPVHSPSRSSPASAKPPRRSLAVVLTAQMRLTLHAGQARGAPSSSPRG